MNLFIIGNGFDLAHGLPTSYGDFRDYLEDVDWSYLESLEEMYGFTIGSSRELVKNYLWRDFETNLSNIDETSIIEQGENIELGLEWEDIGVEDTLYDYWEGQYRFIERLNDFVMSWIKQVDIDIQRITDSIDTEDLFITFNYTLLLEKVYGIDKYNILHIHGSIDEDDNSPVIGHGNKDKIIEIQEIYTEAGEKFYEKKSAIYSAVANYYTRTLKDVDYFIRTNKYFFRRLKDVESIYIIGHSLGEVDIPYFREIYNNVSEDTIWNVYYYSEDSMISYREKIISIGVNEDNIRMLNSNLFFM
ncbi:bacteriophage abortive infection AbiH family protein [Paraclostridium bifermentans]|uniref:Bacteriophage abortive infection AbiH family protein n=1 Tax=Paraclostridium bifermentans TaxID=1490 RepID=A0ABY8R1P9_PARBF|nr:bacteriophage abortive infection AbiH family protein [Paraclostridium bifermentans]